MLATHAREGFARLLHGSIAETFRAPGKNSPTKLGCGQDDLATQCVSPASGERLNEALPRKP